MALPPISVTDLRYLKEDAGLASERLIVGEWYRDLINSHGIDVTYFRRLNSFYNHPGAASGSCNYVYGENPTDPYFLSAGMVVYGEVASDNFVLNNLGIQTDMDVTFFCTVIDFDEQFRDILGTLVSGAFSSDMTGGMTGGTGYVSGSFWNADISGVTSGGLTGSVSGAVSGLYNGLTSVGLKPVNPNIRYLNYYDYSRALTGILTGDWSATLDSSGGGPVTGYSSGVIWYYRPPEPNSGPGWLYHIPPQVGDFMRIQFHSQNPEEYEVTSVENRVLTSDGLNPLLEKYVWRMRAVRRDPGKEMTTTGDQPEEPFTTDKQEEAVMEDIASDKVFDYSREAVDSIDGVDSDKVYGQY